MNGISEKGQERGTRGCEIDKDKKVISGGLKNEMHSPCKYDCLFPPLLPLRPLLCALSFSLATYTHEIELVGITTLKPTEASELKLFAKLLCLFV